VVRTYRIARLLTVGALALGVLGVVAPPAGATPAPAATASARAPLVVPPNCREQDGPSRLARNSWMQQVIVLVCREANNTWNIRAHVLITPRLDLGYAPGNVTNCTAHLQLQHVGGSVDNRAVNGSCTDAATKPAGGNSIPDEIWTGVGAGTYNLSGWDNVDTAAPGVYTGDQWLSISTFTR
jgi:hypothetical protein